MHGLVATCKQLTPQAPAGSSRCPAEQKRSMAVAGVQEELPLQVPRREGPSAGFLALLGASVVVFSVAVVKPPVRAGFGLAGFLLWLLGVARLLLFGQIARRQRPVSPAALAAATARLAADKLKHLFFHRQAPTPERAATPA